MKKSLFEKYDVPVPRYTSYPTVPYWSDSPTNEQWISELRKAASLPKTTWSVYLHLPFCESLCTFCGCNTVITKDHGREHPYVLSLHAEIQNYQRLVPELFKKPLRQIHLGGGTPTFLSADNLEKLMEPIMKSVTLDPEHFDGSIEVDPRKTTLEQLKRLQKFQFSRVSMGVQDFDPEVQRLVNRIQPFEITEALTHGARDLGYSSVNFDLIYGLPKQTLETMKKTAELTIQLRPDRIALYSFALVPWIKPAQRLFKDEDLPAGAEKRALYEIAREMLTEAGYLEIGMDHFALNTDTLSIASQSGQLHRNFMGYTEKRTDVLLGLGVSAISEAPTCFHQNEKVLPVYEKALQEGKLPTFRGHLLTEEDMKNREYILKLITTYSVEIKEAEVLADAKEFLESMSQDGLVRFEGNTLYLTDAGRPFLRNVCVVFDRRLRDKQPQAKVFSQAL
jgi:oxygen-independent coproporphyrinogen-3 oxidase